MKQPSRRKTSWKKWQLHCQLWGTTPWRDYLPAYSLAADAAAAREDLLTLAASFIEASYLSMRPARSGSFPKPSSAYKRWGDISRIHHRQGLPKLDPHHLAQYVRALNQQYKAQHGFDALLVRRKEPLRDAEHTYLLQLPDGFRLGPFIYHHASRFGLMWRTLLKVLNYSGFRKGEWTVRQRGQARP